MEGGVLLARDEFSTLLGFGDRWIDTVEIFGSCDEAALTQIQRDLITRFTKKCGGYLEVLGVSLRRVTRVGLAFEVTTRSVDPCITLASILRITPPPLAPDTVSRIYRNLVRTVSLFHKAGLYHGMLTPDSIVMTADFGVQLRQAGYRLAFYALNLKSPLRSSFKACTWSPPESRRDNDISSFDFEKLDVFGIGCVLLQLVAPSGISRTESIEDALSSDYMLDVPPAVQDFLMRLLHANPNDRLTLKELGGIDISGLFVSKSIKSPMVKTPQLRFERSLDKLSLLAQGPASRYHSDFVEIEFLGSGSFGQVVKVQNRLDGQFYAVKRIKLDPKDADFNKRMVREVMTLSRLHNIYVVRYYQAWVEIDSEEKVGVNPRFSSSIEEFDEDSESDSHHADDWLSMSSSRVTPVSDNILFMDEAQARTTTTGSKESMETTDFETQGIPSSPTGFVPPRTLYIQMEFCEQKTLKTLIDKGMDEAETWKVFRQLMEGLSHIHAQGMIHRDLKPTNIFLDSHGDIKIGDFGLATRLDLAEINKRQSASYDGVNVGSAMTSAVGTSFYIAPEILNPRRPKYDEKVDMYSSGIILFECICPFETQMERAVILTNLRNQDIKFPASLDETKFPQQTRLVRWLLQHDPKNRPTATEVLQSDLLPTKIEDESVLQTLRMVANSRSSFFPKLVSQLFAQQVDRHNDFTYDYNTPFRYSEATQLIKSHVYAQFSSVFKRHAAVELNVPLLTPRSILHDEFSAVSRHMDTDGTIVELPYDLTLPFARWASRHTHVSNLRRWAIGTVYRSNSLGGQPRSINEADFDIVTSGLDTQNLLVHDAEVIYTACEALDEIPVIARQGCVVWVSHGHILEAIFKAAEISVLMKRQLCQLFGGSQARSSWAHVKDRLAASGISPTSIERLEMFWNLRGEFPSCLERVATAFSYSEIARMAVEQLRSIYDHLQQFGLRCKVIFEPLLAYHHQYYKTGCMFQIALVSKKLNILAAGGRYDSLVNSFKHPSTHHKICAVGVNIAMDKICDLVELDRAQTRHHTTANDLVPRRCDVLIISLVKPIIDEKLALCAELWKNNIKADYTVEGHRSVEESLHLCRLYHVKWLVVIKEHPREKKNASFKLKSVTEHGFKQEFEIARRDISDFLHSRLLEQLRVDMDRLTVSSKRRERTISSMSESAGNSPSLASNQLVDYKLNIQVILPPKLPKPKATKKSGIIEKCTRSLKHFIESLVNPRDEAPAEVLACELRLHAIRRMIDCRNLFDEDTFRREVLDVFPQQRDHLLAVRAALVDIKRTLPKSSHLKSVIIYSHIEDGFDIFRFQ